MHPSDPSAGHADRSGGGAGGPQAADGSPSQGVGKGKLTYGSYLKVPELLSLQVEASSPVHHDELLFIVSHQVYELWFKQMLHELHAVCGWMDRDNPSRAAQLLQRVHAIQHLLIEQIPVLETMFSVEFAQFRDHLRPASGFQSVQFRLVEFLCGRKNTRMISLVGDDQSAQSIMQRYLDMPAVYDHFMRMLSRLGVAVPRDLLERDVREAYEGDERMVRLLVSVYARRDQGYELFRLCENLVELDERVSLWRFHHVKMVERMIGGMTGTGGSSGAKYLQSTVASRLFPDLWSVRDHLGTAALGG